MEVSTNTCCLFIYHCNKIEGNSTSLNTVKKIWNNKYVYIKQYFHCLSEDIKETINLVEATKYVLSTVDTPLTEEYIKHLHKLCRQNTIDVEKGYNVGEYKHLNNRVGNSSTSSVKDVEKDIKRWLKDYDKEISNKTLLSQFDFVQYVEYIYAILFHFHIEFEKIHPFQDGNGRVGRLIMFKESLKHLKTSRPIIILDIYKREYYNYFRFKTNFKLKAKLIDLMNYQINLWDVPKKDIYILDKQFVEYCKDKLKTTLEEIQTEFTKNITKELKNIFKNLYLEI